MVIEKDKEMKAFCNLRDIFRSIRDFEERFQAKYDLSLNEGMMLCSLCNSGQLSSTELSEALGLTTSNTSKVIKSVEAKEFVERILGKEDKRQMYFILTDAGKTKLSQIKLEKEQIQQLLNTIAGMAITGV